MKHNKIALIGMMGSGKSTIAKALTKKIDMQLVDLDEIFEKQEKMTINSFFAKFGEEAFRTKESELLEKYAKENNIIISTGGGIVLKQKNRDILFNTDIYTIYLEVDAKNIYNRIKNCKNRPLLQTSDPQEKISKLLNAREEYYKQANYIINTNNKSIEEITREIEQNG